MRVLAAPDKFRGTISATEAAAAIAAGAESAGWEAQRLPLADGGEGTLAAFGGPNRSTRVTGPLHAPVDAAWRLDGRQAVIEMATASGLALAGGGEQNDPIGATTQGTGELILEAIVAGATRIVVGVGGSATTDGGVGAVEALGAIPFATAGVTVEVACDVTTTFLDAARLFSPQKGADEEQILELERRLRLLASRYASELGVDVLQLPHAGAAGGLAGGLAALGAELVPGFDLIADALGVDDAIGRADLVVTGEGALDSTSFRGKVVGGIASRARGRVGILVVAGTIDGELPSELDATSFDVISLTQAFGGNRAWNETAACVAEAVSEHLSGTSVA